MYIVVVGDSEEPEGKEYFMKKGLALRAAMGRWAKDHLTRHVKTWPYGDTVFSTAGRQHPRELTQMDMSAAIRDVFGPPSEAA